MEKVLKLKSLKKTKKNKIKKVSNLNSDTYNIDAIIDEFISSFDKPNEHPNQSNIQQSNGKINLQMIPTSSAPASQPVYSTIDESRPASTPVPKPVYSIIDESKPASAPVPQLVYSIIDESKYDLGEDSNTYETNLLLAYNYFIAPKTILSIGFAPHLNFNSVAMLKQNNIEIVLDLCLWTKVMESAGVIEQAYMYRTSKIETPFLEQELAEIKNTVKNLNVKIYFTIDREYNAKIIIYQNKSKIILDFGAWQKLYLLEYLVQCILYNIKNVDENVRQYYNQYIERCAANQLLILLKNNLMTPTLKNHNMWNYERFFFELPVLCPKKLQQDIHKKMKF